MKKSDNTPGGSASSRYGFEIIFKEDEKYYIQFNDKEGVPLLFSKGYHTEKNCSEGMPALLRAAAAAERYDLHETKKGKYFFTLKSGNQKEVGRSRTFDTLEELEEQMNVLKEYTANGVTAEIQEVTPENEVMHLPAIPQDALNTGTGISPEMESKTPEVTELPIAPPDELEKMPRYKFSVIYYPDSKVWTIKNDFSGDSAKMDACNGQLMEDFIKTQLPTEEQETLVARNKQETLTRKISTPASQQQHASTLIGTLVLRDHAGEMIHGFAKTGSLAMVEFIPESGSEFPDATFNAKVIAKSLENNTSFIIGAIHNQELVNGRLEAPVYGGYNLKKGIYRVMADFGRIEQGAQVSAYHGSQLVMLD